jgi:hypothetical protein
MIVYVYRADLYCEACADRIKRKLTPSEGSERYPQACYAAGGGEADTPQHCGQCGVFLENPLTRDGLDYVAEAIGDYVYHGDGSLDVLHAWARRYKGCSVSIDNAIQEWEALKPQTAP